MTLHFLSHTEPPEGQSILLDQNDFAVLWIYYKSRRKPLLETSKEKILIYYYYCKTKKFQHLLIYRDGWRTDTVESLLFGRRRPEGDSQVYPGSGCFDQLRIFVGAPENILWEFASKGFASFLER